MDKQKFGTVTRHGKEPSPPSQRC